MKLKLNNTTLNVKDNVIFLTFPIFEKYNFVQHAFSTKIGGVSKNEFKSMNFRLFGNEDKENIFENYRRLFYAIGINSCDSIALSSQKHGNLVKIVTEKKSIKENYEELEKQEFDGLITNVKNISLVTHHADCTPIFFLDPEKKVVAVAHSGWKGTAKEISKKIVEKMSLEFSCNPKQIICAIGPTIAQNCYEVSADVYEAFKSKSFILHSSFKKSKNPDKYMFSLRTANKEILKKSGILEKNIFISNVCTHCLNKIFFSHRVSGNKRGTMVAVISLL
ncbi:MAG: peptidoglycan editing factor PgeF [Oscillospiraceae bacterium]|nr:peptidoglycan editing factor PgeF [Oscillospiraceae bacterium]